MLSHVNLHKRNYKNCLVTLLYYISMNVQQFARSHLFTTIWPYSLPILMNFQQILGETLHHKIVLVSSLSLVWSPHPLQTSSYSTLIQLL